VVSPRLSSWPSTLCHVYNPTQYIHLIYVLKSPLVCRRHTTLPFLPSITFYSNIIHLQNALQQISSWMTANILILNSSKTEFFSYRTSTTTSKIHDSSLTTTHYAGNLGFIFDEHLTFSGQISAVYKSCYYYIRELCCIDPPMSRLQNSQHHCHLHWQSLSPAQLVVACARRHLLILSCLPCTRRSTIGDRAFAVDGPRTWNSIPSDITAITSFDTFKKHLKSHLFQLSFSSPYSL